jgi:uncharacterized protein
VGGYLYLFFYLRISVIIFWSFISGGSMDNLKVLVRHSGNDDYGNAVFAVANINKGEIIAVFDGPCYEAEGAMEMTNDPPLFVARHAVQFEKHRWRDSIGIARCINHSCNPNCGIKNLFEVVAMHDIAVGEEITWDYAMTEDSDWIMKCMCGETNCRGIVGAYSMLTEEDRKRYEGYISQWLLK